MIYLYILDKGGRQIMVRAIRPVLMLLAATLLLAGCGNGKSGASSDKVSYLDAEAVEHSGAVAIYKKRCLSCHGNELQGRAGPGLKTIGDVLEQQQIFEVISDGRTKKGMPAFGKTLDEDEIHKLAAWLADKKT